MSLQNSFNKIRRNAGIKKCVIIDGNVGDVYLDDKNKIVIDFHVIVAYGVSISTVADNLVHNVKYKVEEFTGMKVGRINVYVEGVRIID